MGTSHSSLGIAISSIDDVKTSVAKTQQLLYGLITRQESVQGASLRFHRQLQEQIDQILQTVNGLCSRNHSYSDDLEQDIIRGPVLSSSGHLNIAHRDGSWGNLTIAYGSSSFLTPNSPRRPGGSGLQVTYMPPPWIFRLVLSMSFAARFIPRLHVDFNLHMAAVVADDAKIFGAIWDNDMDGLEQLIWSGAADARDRTRYGVTPLHVSAIRRLCRNHAFEPPLTYHWLMSTQTAAFWGI